MDSSVRWTLSWLDYSGFTGQTSSPSLVGPVAPRACVTCCYILLLIFVNIGIFDVI